VHDVKNAAKTSELSIVSMLIVLRSPSGNEKPSYCMVAAERLRAVVFMGVPVTSSL
jgi:hypothetical protein